MMGLERAVQHGYLRATVKGFAEKRERRWRYKHDAPKSTGPNLSGWAQLAAIAADSGRLVQGGERLVA